MEKLNTADIWKKKNYAGYFLYTLLHFGTKLWDFRQLFI